MPGLDAAFYPALWDLAIATGSRPEVFLIVWWAESGLNPGIANTSGCVGLNQSCPKSIGGPGFPDGYQGWPASQQLTQWIAAQVTSEIHDNGGPFLSAARYQQANFLPATLPNSAAPGPKAKLPGDVICAKAGPYASAYAGNAQFDLDKTGTITLDDLGTYLQTRASGKYGANLRSAIATTYGQVPAGAPWSSPAADPYHEPGPVGPRPPGPPPAPAKAPRGSPVGFVVAAAGLGLGLLALRSARRVPA